MRSLNFWHGWHCIFKGLINLQLAFLILDEKISWKFAGETCFCEYLTCITTDKLCHTLRHLTDPDTKRKLLVECRSHIAVCRCLWWVQVSIYVLEATIFLSAPRLFLRASLLLVSFKLFSITFYFASHQGSETYGLDFWMNEEPVWNETGHYSTELFTEKAISLINDQDNTKVSL